MQLENCVTFWSSGGISSAIFGNLLKIFEFCKMFWIANNVCDAMNLEKLLVSFLICFLMRFKNFDVGLRKLLEMSPADI